MAVCTGQRQTELQFIQASRGRATAECGGPLLVLSLSLAQLSVLNDAASDAAIARLWVASAGVNAHRGLDFQLCAAHWMDLIYWCGIHSALLECPASFTLACALIRALAQAAGWDMRELANLLAWQRVALT